MRLIMIMYEISSDVLVELHAFHKILLAESRSLIQLVN